MTDQPKPTVEERSTARAAARQALEDARRAALATLQLDGPFPLGSGDLLSSVFGGGPRSEFAVCLRCGSIVVLGDPEERTDGPPIERGVRLHTSWHERLEASR